MEEFQNYPQNKYDIKVYLIHIHGLLVHISYYFNQGAYGIAFEGLYQDFYFKELIERKWGLGYLSNSTLDMLALFHKEWKEYVLLNSFGNSFFVFYDPEYHKMVKDFLLPALENMEQDFVTYDVLVDNLSWNSYKTEYNPETRPSDNDVIWKIEMIYKVLSEKNIISKPYMGED